MLLVETMKQSVAMHPHFTVVPLQSTNSHLTCFSISVNDPDRKYLNILTKLTIECNYKYKRVNKTSIFGIKLERNTFRAP